MKTILALNNCHECVAAIRQQSEQAEAMKPPQTVNQTKP
jgi:hypothetical protein